MSKQDDPFQPEQVDEQIESLAHLEHNSSLPEARLASDLRQVYAEEHEIVERVWTHLSSHATQHSQGHPGLKHPKDHIRSIFISEAQPMKTSINQQPPAKKRWHILETIAAALVVVALGSSMALLLHARQAPSSSPGNKPSATYTSQLSTGTPIKPTATPIPIATASPQKTATASPIPLPPTSVIISLSAPGIPPTTQGEITIHSGTKVTLTVIPNHSLLPFQTYTMGIYATDPYPFSELQYCTYPNTATCTYIVANSPGENTDYTKGKHTFVAFLGDIGGRVLYNSNNITITWS